MLPDDPENPTKYVSTRMIAPGKGQKYFFSTQGEQYVAKDQPFKAQGKVIKEIREFGPHKGEPYPEPEDKYNV